MNQKILIVEDDVIFCKLLTRFLSKNDYEVKDVQNSLDAFKLMENDFFGIAILDYQLPDMNGIEILKKIKISFPDTKIILITRYGDDEVAQEAKSAGANAFVSKPINPEELLDLINSVR
jgi:two-component system response regulator HydG